MPDPRGINSIVSLRDDDDPGSSGSLILMLAAGPDSGARIPWLSRPQITPILPTMTYTLFYALSFSVIICGTGRTSPFCPGFTGNNIF